MRPQPPPSISPDRATAMNQMYGGSTVNISHHVNKPITKANAMRAAGAVTAFAGGPLALTVRLFLYQPLKYALIDYLGDKMNPQTPDVVVDKYTESILAEVMSSQQTESKLGSAPSFIRPKKKELLYKK